MRDSTGGLVSRLLEARADPNPPTGFSPLLMAVARGNIHLVTLLLCYRACPDIVATTGGLRGLSPLSLALQWLEEGG